MSITVPPALATHLEEQHRQRKHNEALMAETLQRLETASSPATLWPSLANDDRPPQDNEHKTTFDTPKPEPVQQSHQQTSQPHHSQSRQQHQPQNHHHTTPTSMPIYAHAPGLYHPFQNAFTLHTPLVYGAFAPPPAMHAFLQDPTAEHDSDSDSDGEPDPRPQSHRARSARAMQTNPSFSAAAAAAAAAAVAAGANPTDTANVSQRHFSAMVQGAYAHYVAMSAGRSSALPDVQAMAPQIPPQPSAVAAAFTQYMCGYPVVLNPHIAALTGGKQSRAADDSMGTRTARQGSPAPDTNKDTADTCSRGSDGGNDSGDRDGEAPDSTNIDDTAAGDDDLSGGSMRFIAAPSGVSTLSCSSAPFLQDPLCPEAESMEIDFDMSDDTAAVNDLTVDVSAAVSDSNADALDVSNDHRVPSLTARDVGVSETQALGSSSASTLHGQTPSSPIVSDSSVDQQCHVVDIALHDFVKPGATVKSCASKRRGGHSVVVAAATSAAVKRAAAVAAAAVKAVTDSRRAALEARGSGEQSSSSTPSLSSAASVALLSGLPVQRVATNPALCATNQLSKRPRRQATDETTAGLSGLRKTAPSQSSAGQTDGDAKLSAKSTPESTTHDMDVQREQGTSSAGTPDAASKLDGANDADSSNVCETPIKSVMSTEPSASNTSSSDVREVFSPPLSSVTVASSALGVKPVLALSADVTVPALVSPSPAIALSLDGHPGGAAVLAAVSPTPEMLRERARDCRQAAIKRFREKKASRRFGQKKLIRYQSRKRIAEVRPRVNGRFVRLSPEVTVTATGAMSTRATTAANKETGSVNVTATQPSEGAVADSS